MKVLSRGLGCTVWGLGLGSGSSAGGEEGFKELGFGLGFRARELSRWRGTA